MVGRAEGEIFGRCADGGGWFAAMLESRYRRYIRYAFLKEVGWSGRLPLGKSRHRCFSHAWKPLLAHHDAFYNSRVGFLHTAY